MNHTELDEARSFLNPMCGMATAASALLFGASAAGTGYLYVTGGNPILGKILLDVALGGVASTAFSMLLLAKSEPPSVTIPKNHRLGFVAGAVLAAACTFGASTLFNRFGEYVSRPDVLIRQVAQAPAVSTNPKQDNPCNSTHGVAVVVGTGDKKKAFACR